MSEEGYAGERSFEIIFCRSSRASRWVVKLEFPNELLL